MKMYFFNLHKKIFLIQNKGKWIKTTTIHVSDKDKHKFGLISFILCFLEFPNIWIPTSYINIEM